MEAYYSPLVCNLLTLGGWAGKAFPYSEGAGDVTISGATTWSDSAGFKRVGVLTIDSGQVLTIARSPFFIFANEIVFGSTTSRISGDGPSGSSSLTTAPAYAEGGIATSGSARAQGGCGGILLIIVCNKISGAAGLITVNGGNGFRNTTNAAAATGSRGMGAMDYYNNRSSARWTETDSTTFPGIFWAHLLGLAGGSTATAGRDGDSGVVSSTAPGGGSGIGGGGSAATTGGTAGSTSVIPPSPLHLLWLASNSCLGGGGGAAEVNTTGTNNGAGGGGGGGLLVYTDDAAVTPTLQADGGVGTTNGGNGGNGVTHFITLQ